MNRLGRLGAPSATSDASVQVARDDRERPPGAALRSSRRRTAPSSAAGRPTDRSSRDDPGQDHDRERHQERRQHKQRDARHSRSDTGARSGCGRRPPRSTASPDSTTSGAHDEILRPAGEQREQPHRHDRGEREEINEAARRRIDRRRANNLRRRAARSRPVRRARTGSESPGRHGSRAGRQRASPRRADCRRMVAKSRQRDAGAQIEPDQIWKQHRDHRRCRRSRDRRSRTARGRAWSTPCRPAAAPTRISPAIRGEQQQAGLHAEREPVDPLLRAARRASSAAASAPTAASRGSRAELRRRHA